MEYNSSELDRGLVRKVSIIPAGSAARDAYKPL